MSQLKKFILGYPVILTRNTKHTVSSRIRSNIRQFFAQTWISASAYVHLPPLKAEKGGSDVDMVIGKPFTVDEIRNALAKLIRLPSRESQ